MTNPETEIEAHIAFAGAIGRILFNLTKCPIPSSLPISIDLSIKSGEEKS